MYVLFLAKTSLNGKDGHPMERQATTRQRAPLPATQKVELKQLKRPKQSTISESDLRRRAYEIYLKRGSKPGSEIEDWLQAERELKEN